MFILLQIYSCTFSKLFTSTAPVIVELDGLGSIRLDLAIYCTLNLNLFRLRLDYAELSSTLLQICEASAAESILHERIKADAERDEKNRTMQEQNGKLRNSVSMTEGRRAISPENGAR